MNTFLTPNNLNLVVHLFFNVNHVCGNFGNCLYANNANKVLKAKEFLIQ